MISEVSPLSKEDGRPIGSIKKYLATLVPPANEPESLMREGREPKAKPRLSNTPSCSRAPLTADFFNTIDSSRTSSKRPRKSWLSSPIMKMLWDAPPPEMICRIRMLPPLRSSRGLLWINSSYDPRFRKSRTRPIRLSPDNGVADIAALRICAMRQTSSLLPGLGLICVKTGRHFSRKLADLKSPPKSPPRGKEPKTHG